MFEVKFLPVWLVVWVLKEALSYNVKMCHLYLMFSLLQILICHQTVL